LVFGFISELHAAAPPAASQTDPPVYKTHARDVVVDVVVTGSKDEPVQGLRAQDFVVIEDGKPQKVDYFEGHSARTLLPEEFKPLPPMPAGVYTNVPPAPESDAVNVLLLDALNTDKEDQIYVHNQIMEFLRNMQPGTRAAVFTLSSQLRMVQGFTADTAVLREALNNPKYGVAPVKPNESRSIEDKFEDVEHIKTMVKLLGGWDEGITAIDSFQQDHANTQAEQRIGMTLEALQYLARYLAGVPGRKNLIWFSSSFPVTVFPRVGESQHPNQMNTDSMKDYAKIVRETADLLTVSKIAVYPIGAEGVMSEHVFEANTGGPTDYEGMSQGGSGKGNGVMTPYIHENGARSDKITAMEQLATDTGGKAFYNTNDLNAAMQHAIADGSHYYTIVYSPTNRMMDGSYRRIEIKVPESKVKLSYRRGYNADDSLALDTKPNTDPLQPLLLRGMPSATQLLYGVRVVPVDPQPAANAPRAGKNAKLTGPTKRFSVDFMIRWTDVKLDPASDGKYTGKLQVELLAYDHAGHAVNWVGGTQAMNLTPDLYAAMQRSGVPAHFEIDLPADSAVFLETGVYDWTTGKAGTLEIPVHSVRTTTASTARRCLLLQLPCGGLTVQCAKEL
jgi:VWFA-related protein